MFLDNTYIERKSVIKLLGVWISEKPGCWQYNTQQIVKRTFARLHMLTKLKYAGAPFEKLLHLYCLFIRPSTEFCSVLWHGNLSQNQSNSIERLQIVCLKVILGERSPKLLDGHLYYQEALRICKLKSLFLRREGRMLDFGRKCILHPTLSRLFPPNQAIHDDPHSVRSREMFHVNFARTEVYRDSAIPTIQRRLNQHFTFTPVM